MAALNLYQYAHVFQRNNVDGQSLLTLNQDKLQVSRRLTYHDDSPTASKLTVQFMQPELLRSTVETGSIISARRQTFLLQKQF